MRESYPTKTPGPNAPPTSANILGASHINMLSQNAQIVGQMAPGTNLHGMHTGVGIANVADRPFMQEVFEITSTKISENDSSSSGLYVGFPVRYSELTQNGTYYKGEWHTSKQEGWLIDARPTQLKLNVGDRVVAYYEIFRDAWIPTETGTPPKPCAPYAEFDSIEPQVYFTQLYPFFTWYGGNVVENEDPSVAGAVGWYALEISTDGGRNWKIAQNRKWRMALDWEEAGPVSSTGFVTFVANHKTKLRIVAGKGNDAYGPVALNAASMRVIAVCEGGQGHFHSPPPDQAISTRVTNIKVTSVVGNDLSPSNQGAITVNHAAGLPEFYYRPDYVEIHTPLEDPKNPGTQRELWTIAVDFGVTMQPLVPIGCNSLLAIMKKSYGSTPVDWPDVPAVNLGPGGDGDCFAASLFLNDGQIDGKQHVEGLVEIASSTTGFSTFKVNHGDIITLRVGRSSGTECKLISNSLRLEAKCRVSVEDIEFFGLDEAADANAVGWLKCSFDAGEATINNHLLHPHWPQFILLGDRKQIRVSCPREPGGGTAAWWVEAEFHAGVNTQEQESSSSSSISSSQSSANSSISSINSSSSQSSISSSLSSASSNSSKSSSSYSKSFSSESSSLAP